MTSAGDAGADLLDVRGLTKRFGPVNALVGLDVRIRAGEVHALIGQNGSGKSTLIKSLAGYHQPDEGTITLRGAELSLPASQGALADAGLAFLHQDAPVAPAMTVLENIRVGRYRQPLLGKVSPAAERRRVRALLDSMGVAADPDDLAGDLPTADRALIGFAAAVDALSARPGVLVLDEPTASLPPGAAQRLFDAIARVTSAGSGVLFVSHRLDEVLAISDRISVLRDGRLVTTLERADADEDQLVRLMLGRDLDEIYPERPEDDDEQRPVVLELRGMRGRLVDDVALRVRAGEIVGVTGLVGMGQDELPYLAYGALPSGGGEVRIHGEPLPKLTPAHARRRGVALVPADRPRASGSLSATITENISLPVLPRFFRGGALRARHERANARRLVADFDVRPARIDLDLGQLSGGNQQKVLLAKWLQSSLSLLLLHEPTLGVDIGSRAQIFGIIRAAADEGMAVLVASSEYEDLAGICDRVVVLNRGRVVAELAADRLSEDAILRACFVTTGDAVA